MTNETFEGRVNSHPDLVFFQGESEGKYFVQNRRNDRFEVPANAVTESEWFEWEAVLTGKRRIDNMHHISRIVGYMSFHHSWNPSKLAELRDRRRGNYALPV